MPGATANNNPPGDICIPAEDDSDCLPESHLILSETHGHAMLRKHLALIASKDQDTYSNMEQITIPNYRVWSPSQRHYCNTASFIRHIRSIYGCGMMSTFYWLDGSPVIQGIQSLFM